MWSTIPAGGEGAQTMAYGAGQPAGSVAGLEYVPAEQDGAIQGGTNAGGFCTPRSLSPARTLLIVNVLRSGFVLSLVS